MLPRLLARLSSLPVRSIGVSTGYGIRAGSGSARGKPMEEARFSKSAAFQGRAGRGAGVVGSAHQFDYYSTDEFGNKKLLSAILSITALVVYFGWLREPSDLDEILNTPQHILTASLERKMLSDQIKQAQEKGESTELLQAQLDYVDVKEAALKIQFKK
ncbi:hypothetical protein PRIPAC_73288 [Pristionchus pacificus]|uniref:Uncharacterized protein n=1 Tax=Pristionchus pacificus TaxID=54126 RepID=A0A2A6B555_PRIPA|nr:hypothetical protein PRIPAC_73288 [Pristionchus pacificus]|eukprot:PDM60983.1 hypothetical protein PRIPAC_54789 [Pristionchus pacificus]